MKAIILQLADSAPVIYILARQDTAMRILVTKPILNEALEALKPLGAVDVAGGLSYDNLRAVVRDYDAIVSMLTDKFDAGMFEYAKGGPLRIVANYAVGHDNIDTVAAKAAGIWATNTPDALTEATAEMAWALVFAAARRLIEGDVLARSGEWKGWTPTQLVGSAISGGVVGIVGAGRIGQAFARMGAGFRVTVLYHNRKRDEKFERTGAAYRDLDSLLAESDIVSVHLPANAESRRLISKERIAKMKPSAILVSTGRGNVIDEAALAEALKARRIRAAGLDVYENEPSIHADLIGLPNVVLAPHLGSATTSSRVGMALRCADNIRDAIAGRRPKDALQA